MTRISCSRTMGTVLSLLWLCQIALTAGCAGARVEVTAVNSRYPISLSHIIRDKAGRLYGEGSLTRVGRFSVDRTPVGFFYSALTVPWTYDISNEVNRQVSAVAGEAIVDLAVAVSTNCNLLNAFPFLNSLPLWPGCVPVVVTGAIVRR